MKENKNSCFCCNNITCEWTPGYRMLNIIRECKDLESWFRDVRSAYFGSQVLKQKKKLYKESIPHICSYIYNDTPPFFNANYMEFNY